MKIKIGDAMNLTKEEQAIFKGKDPSSLTKDDWYNISGYQKLSEAFIEKYKDKVDWSGISRYQKLSMHFITKYKDKVDWSGISCYRKLSEAFIEKYQDTVDWWGICRH